MCQPRRPESSGRRGCFYRIGNCFCGNKIRVRGKAYSTNDRKLRGQLACGRFVVHFVHRPKGKTSLWAPSRAQGDGEWIVPSRFCFLQIHKSCDGTADHV